MRLIANFRFLPELPEKATGPGKRKPCSGSVIPKQMLRMTKIMKITTALFLVGCLQSMAAGYAQKVSLSEKDARIEKVFKEIRRQTGYQFLYTSKMVERARKLTLDVNNAPLNDVLDKCFEEQPFTYEIKDKTIVIKSKPQPQQPAKQPDPPIDIKGRLVNDRGEPIPGASVSIKGTLTRVLTNVNGEFTLVGVEENAILQISHVQYEDAVINVNGNPLINATLVTRVSSLDETQVIAYGTVTKRLNSGNVYTIKSKDLSKQPVNNPLLAIQGRVPGLMIIQQTGVPGGGYEVLIRGRNSMTNGNSPLYVIDGVPYSDQLVPNSGGLATSSSFGNNSSTTPSPLNFLNLADIESIDVLKDADATAIYGTRAANGVIMITTRKGKAGKTSVDLNVYTGVGEVPKMMKLMNTEQYLEMRNEAFANDGATPGTLDHDVNGDWGNNRYTDWQQLMIGGKANYTDAQATVSGGSTNVQYLINGGYHKETTVYPGDFHNTRGSMHFNLNANSNNNRFKIQLTGSYTSSNIHLAATDFFHESRLYPNAPDLYDMNGKLNWENNTFSNPFANLLVASKQQVRNLVSNSKVSYELLKGLVFETSLGYTEQHFNDLKAIPKSSIRPNLPTIPNTAFGFNDKRTWLIEPQVKYRFSVSDAKFDILVGATIQENESIVNRINGQGYTDEKLMESMAGASALEPAYFFNAKYKYNAVFGRINYNWQEKYIVNLTARRDGTSRFGPESRFNNFGAVGAAWLFSNEEFVRNSFAALSFGKIRLSYGTTGNDQIDDYRFLDLYSFDDPSIPPVTVPYQGTNGLFPRNLYNSKLAWEVNKKAEAGLELGFLQDRFFVSGSYFRNRSTNQLISAPLPYTTGFSNIPINLPALVENTGWEVLVRTFNVKNKDFSWVSSINFTKQDNKLLEYPDLEKAPTLSRLYKVGNPITVKSVYDMIGVDPGTGLYIFRKADGTAPTSQPSVDDRTVLLNTDPRYFGGFQNTISYKNFELDFFFQFVKQLGRNPIYFNNLAPGIFSRFSPINWPVEILENRWQKDGDNARIQKFTRNTGVPLDAYLAAQSSNDSWVDASYIRLKNISLSYRLPETWVKQMHLQNVRIYIQGQNLLTITDYNGMDPETQLSIPPLRVLTGGIAVGL